MFEFATTMKNLLKKFFKINKLILFCIGIVVCLFLLEDTVLLINKFHSNYPILGQQLNNIPVSNRNQQEIISFIQSQFDQNIPLKLSINGKKYLIYKKDVGAKIDYNKTIANVYTPGRTGNFFPDLITQNKALFGGSNAQLQVSLSKSLILLTTLSIADTVNKQPQPAMPDFKKNIFNTIPQKNGIKINSTAIAAVIDSYIFVPPATAIVIPTQIISKKYRAYDLNAIRKQALDYTSRPISITSGGVLFTLTPSDLKYLLSVSEQVDPTNPKQTIMGLTLDRINLVHLLAPYATEVEAATHAEFNEYDIYPTIYSQFYTNTRRVVDVPIGARLNSEVLGTSTTATQSGEKIVYLTFDDGPNIIYHPILLGILKEKNIKATFYLVGANSTDYK